MRSDWHHHTHRSYCIFPLRTFWCVQSTELYLMPFPHSLHIWGFSPKCNCWWSSRLEPRLKHLSFSSKVCSPEWIIRCWDDFFMKSFPQILVAIRLLAFECFLIITMVMRDPFHNTMITPPQFISSVNLLTPTLKILWLFQVHFLPEISDGLKWKFLIFLYYWNFELPLEASLHNSHLQKPE